ncbi:MAG: hypothetical protein CL874_01800 [Dehalococcoidales bacterium]|jgi:hypothetical protein|nr:hypothetical protein [Dehalococcoidales bacterium]|tara:strand:+ start:2204 stop:3055 length:852 start_codon:yes stop_codon:yes gene_type:complete
MEARHNGAFAEICQHRLEAIYEFPEGERGGAFAAAYITLFEERQLGKLLNALLAEFPTLQGLEEVLVFKTVSLREEGTELRRDRTKMGIRLRVERFRGPEWLEPFLRHELMHISDMLDPGFGYRDELLDQVQERLVPRRYQVLWDTYIDGRLERRGQGGITNREERQREFEQLFSFLPRRQRMAVFQWLWSAQDITHTQLLELAEDPARLGLLGVGVGEVPSAPIPGIFCPLCQFPTFEWADPESGTLPVIQRDFPTWTREEGICGQCYEYYRMRCKKEGVTL